MRGEVPAWLLAHRRSRYIVSAILSFPFWASRAELRRIDEEAKRLTRSTGVPHEVDHIVPVNHPHVCGLTVPWNLQILTQRENGSKGSTWSDDETNSEQLTLFERNAVEQYELSI